MAHRNARAASCPAPCIPCQARSACPLDRSIICAGHARAGLLAITVYVSYVAYIAETSQGE
eukprot:5320911-Alexandrium_andersonii.AAC.1